MLKARIQDKSTMKIEIMGTKHPETNLGLKPLAPQVFSTETGNGNKQNIAAC